MTHPTIQAFRARLSEQLRAFEASLEADSSFRLRYPEATSIASLAIEHLGYNCGRANLDYCTRHAKRLGFKPPKSRDGELTWTRENVIDFALQLERMRAWLPGRHDERKTCFELAAERERLDEASNAFSILQHLSTPDLLDVVVGIDWPETVAFRSIAAGLYVAKVRTHPNTINAPTLAALTALIENRSSAKLRTLLAKIRAQVRKVKR